MSKAWHITGFEGVNNVQAPTALKQPTRNQHGQNVGVVELQKCINFDIDDENGLIKRDDAQVVFTKAYDAKLTKTLGAFQFVASGSRLTYSKPFQTAQDARRTSITYPSLITLIEEVEEGMWVGTVDAIYFHKGKNPTVKGGFTQIAEYDAVAIMGTGEKVSAIDLGVEGGGFAAIFATTNGICYGDKGGNLVNISEGIFSYKPGTRGISHIKADNGFVQYQVKMINEAADSYNEHERKVPITVDTQP